MQVVCYFHPPLILTLSQHFIVQVSGSVGALKEMTASVENDLRSLFSYFGESFDSPDSLKPEDFFGMICSFSLSLQVRLCLAAWIALFYGIVCLQKAANDVAPRTPARPLRSAADKPEVSVMCSWRRRLSESYRRRRSRVQSGQQKTYSPLRPGMNDSGRLVAVILMRRCAP